MGRHLNIGMIQSCGGSMDFESCLPRIRRDTDELMSAMNIPELIVGAEMSIGMYWQTDKTKIVGDPIPGKVTERLSAIAKEYGIYFMPGSMAEVVKTDEKDVFYNSIPIFGPDGEIIDVYRKMCPYYPNEGKFTKGDRYVTFDIKEKNIKIGVLNCHDWCFPEISRNLALMGAEILIRPAADPEGLYQACKSIAPTRAFENQAYFISVNMAGEFLGSYTFGHSVVAAPDGNIIYEAGSSPVSLTMTFDADRVSEARQFGTNYTEQLLRQLKVFNPPMPFAGKIGEAPIYSALPDPDMSPKSRKAHLRENGVMSIGKRSTT